MHVTPHERRASCRTRLRQPKWPRLTRGSEPCFRDIKTTLGLDVLRCQTPVLVEKEVWLQAMAYNLVRALMLEAAWTHSVKLERLSFKGTAAVRALDVRLQARSGRIAASHRRRPGAAATEPIRTARPEAPAEVVSIAHTSAS